MPQATGHKKIVMSPVFTVKEPSVYCHNGLKNNLPLLICSDTGAYPAPVIIKKRCTYIAHRFH